MNSNGFSRDRNFGHYNESRSHAARKPNRFLNTFDRLDGRSGDESQTLT